MRRSAAALLTLYRWSAQENHHETKEQSMKKI